MTGQVTLCRVPPALVDHVRELLADAGLTSLRGDLGTDGLVGVEIAEADAERARSVIGLVLPHLLEPRTDGPALSDRLVRSEPPPEPAGGMPTLPGGLVDGRSVGGYADPLADPDPHDQAENFTPPPPPPIPRPRDRAAAAAWCAVIGGPALLVITHVLGLSSLWTAVGLGAFIVGFGVLVARMDDHRGNRDGWDDGASL